MSAQNLIDNNFVNKYINCFNQLEILNRGSFGVVYKVEQKVDGNPTDKIFAMKKFRILENDMIDSTSKEIKIISMVKSNFTVNFVDAWTEDDFGFIQMELCSGNLATIIETKPFIFNRDVEDIMNSFEFFISIELLKEVTECLNFLHSLSPPILHRDLKPENVLITNGQNNRFLKLCDFGLAKIHEYSKHTRNKGTQNYMAQEVIQGNKYNLKADVYSLCIIALELFGLKSQRTAFDVEMSNEILGNYKGTSLQYLFEHLFETLIFCLTKGKDNYGKRLSSQQFLVKLNSLNYKNSFTPNDTILQNTDTFHSEEEKIANDFLINFSNAKLNG